MAPPVNGDDSMAQADVSVKEKTALKEPPMFRVVYLNDDVTTVDFVLESLVTFFHYSPETAERITYDIHEQGAATVAVLPYEIAEQKGIEVTVAARSQQYPLQIRLEPEEV